MESKSSKAKNIIIVILAFLVGMLLSYVVFSTLAGKGPASVSQNQTPNDAQSTQNENPLITPNPSNPDENIMTLASFGLSFRYSKYEYSFDEDHPGLNRSVSVNEPQLSENVISFGPSYDSSLTIYDKDPGQSLETAIRNKFLMNIPSTQCQLVRVQAGTEYQYYPASTNINYVVMHPVVPNGCPTQFDTTNPSTTFFSFSNNPTKMFYVTGEPDGTMPLLTANGEPFWVTMKFN